MLDDLDIKKLTISVLFSALRTEEETIDETIEQAYAAYNKIVEKELLRYKR